MNTFKRKALSCAILAGLAAASALSGCAGFGVPTMTAEQLAASAKDKNASVACATGTGTGGKGSVVYVNVDKSSINSGSVVVDENCRVTISTAQRP
jgi:hypothetical protein